MVLSISCPAKAMIHRKREVGTPRDPSQHRSTCSQPAYELQRMVQAPLMEDITHKFHDCTVWSKLELKQGYHQLTLDEQTCEIATFSTPWGNYRPKRLVFGARSSQDAFDDVMYRIFGNIPRCLKQQDDILLGGKVMAEHDAVLEQVLQQAIDFNVTFNIKNVNLQQKP